jgi:hypothetical protein
MRLVRWSDQADGETLRSVAACRVLDRYVQTQNLARVRADGPYIAMLISLMSEYAVLSGMWHRVV